MSAFGKYGLKEAGATIEYAQKGDGPYMKAPPLQGKEHELVAAVARWDATMEFRPTWEEWSEALKHIKREDAEDRRAGRPARVADNPSFTQLVKKKTKKGGVREANFFYPLGRQASEQSYRIEGLRELLPAMRAWWQNNASSDRFGGRKRTCDEFVAESAFSKFCTDIATRWGASRDDVTEAMRHGED